MLKLERMPGTKDRFTVRCIVDGKQVYAVYNIDIDSALRLMEREKQSPILPRKVLGNTSALH